MICTYSDLFCFYLDLMLCTIFRIKIDHAWNESWLIDVLSFDLESLPVFWQSLNISPIKKCVIHKFKNIKLAFMLNMLKWVKTEKPSKRKVTGGEANAMLYWSLLMFWFGPVNTRCLQVRLSCKYAFWIPLTVNEVILNINWWLRKSYQIRAEINRM